MKLLLDNLEYYATLNVQPINWTKTEALWSARAIGNAKFEIKCGDGKESDKESLGKMSGEITVRWVKEYKYLGYWITPKLGFSNMIHKTKLKIRQRLAMVNCFRLSGSTSAQLRKALFDSYILPLFTWLFPVFPLFTQAQQNDLSHFYYSCLRRIYHCLHIKEDLFSYIVGEISLEDRCHRYWNKYLIALSDTVDGELIFGSANLSLVTEAWRQSDFPISGLFRSKRYVEHESVLLKILSWCAGLAPHESVPNFDIDEVMTLAEFPESF